MISKKKKENKITSRLNDLMEEYEIYSNVNFFDVEDDKKIIEVDHKGGWSSNIERKEQSGGGWIIHDLLDSE